jgi:hypothetical protein
MRSAYRSAQRVTTTAHNVLVTVTLEDGTIGYGESAPASYVTGETQESVWQWIRDLAPRLRNRPHDDVEGLIPSAGGAMPGAVGRGGDRYPRRTGAIRRPAPLPSAGWRCRCADISLDRSFTADPSSRRGGIPCRGRGHGTDFGHSRSR